MVGTYSAAGLLPAFLRGDLRSGGLGPETSGLLRFAFTGTAATAGESSREHRVALCGGRPASAEPPRTLSTGLSTRLASIFFGMLSQHATQLASRQRALR